MLEQFHSPHERERYRQKLIGIALQQFVSASQTKLTVRQSVQQKKQQQEIDRYGQYTANPVQFFTTELDYYLWSKQREIAEAIVKYDRVAVHSAHETGKSFVCGGLVPWWIMSHPIGDAMVVTTAPTFNQVANILWKEIRRAIGRGHFPGYTNETAWKVNGEVVAFGRKPDDASPDAFQGIHALHLLVIIDEACGVVGNLWDAAESLVANEGGKILAIGNPDDPNTYFGKICKPGSGWHVIHISAFHTPNLTGEKVPARLSRSLISRKWVEDRARGWGAASPIYISKVTGQFPEISEDTLIQPRWVTAAVNRDMEPDDDAPNELGVDVARSENGNETVIYHRHGNRARLWKAVRTRDLMRICGWIRQAVEETGAIVVKVDDSGLGGGVTDRLTEISREPAIDAPNVLGDVRIIGVNVGRSPIERDEHRRAKVDVKGRYYNLRSQLAWELRERFREGEIDLDDDLDTQAQICEVRYTTHSSRGIWVEAKDEMAERLVKLSGMTGESGSPDRWDALVLAFADCDERSPFLFSDALVEASMYGRRY